MDDLDARLRDRLFLTRINRQLSRRRRVADKDDGTQRLHADLDEVVAEVRRLKRRAAWLLKTGKPLPTVVKR
jgi:hypothetical protein